MKTRRIEIVRNTGKITLAAIIAILLAKWLGLDYAVSAGVIAMLSIQPTKKETVRTAAERIMAFASSLGIAYLCFSLLGYTLMAFAFFIFFFVWVCYAFGWTGAITVNVVLISHLLDGMSMQPDAIANEILLFGIGVCAGITANLHLKKNVDAMEALKGKTDEQMKRILAGMAEHIIEGDSTWENREHFDKLDAYIRDAKNMAEANYGNQFRRADKYDIEYMNMREKQCQVLYEMEKLLRHMHAKPVTAKRISEFLKTVAREYHQTNTVDTLLEEFRGLETTMKQAPLPAAREEFEDRAKLFILLRLLEEFLLLKKEFAQTFSLERH